MLLGLTSICNLIAPVLQRWCGRERCLSKSAYAITDPPARAVFNILLMFGTIGRARAGLAQRGEALGDEVILHVDYHERGAPIVSWLTRLPCRRIRRIVDCL